VEELNEVNLAASWDADFRQLKNAEPGLWFAAGSSMGSAIPAAADGRRLQDWGGLQGKRSGAVTQKFSPSKYRSHAP